VSFLLAVSQDASAGPAPVTAEIDLAFAAGANGQPGVGFADILGVTVNPPVLGQSDDGDSTATLLDEQLVGPFTKQGTLSGTFRVDDLDPGETVVVRIDVRAGCEDGTDRAGDLDARATGAREVGPDAHDIKVPELVTLVQQVQKGPEDDDDDDDGTTTTTEAEAPSTTSTEPSTTTAVTPTTHVGGPGDEPGDGHVSVAKALLNNDDADHSLSVTVGDTLTYGVYVHNDGDVVLHDLDISDDLAGAGPVACPEALPLDLGVGDSVFCTVTYVVTAADATANRVRNTATAQAEEASATSPPVDVTVFHPALHTTKALSGNLDEDGSQSITAGDTLVYTITAFNAGDVALQHLHVTDDLPGAGPVLCPDTFTGHLATGTFVTCSVSYVVTPADIEHGSITNTATAANEAASDTSDPVTVSIAALLTLTNTPDRSSAVAGDTVTFTVKVGNGGGRTLTNVHVTDPDLGIDTTLPSLAVGASQAFAVPHLVTVDDAAKGTLQNTAHATSVEALPVSATASVAVSAPTAVLDAVIPAARIQSPGSSSGALPLTGGRPDGPLWLAAALGTAGAAYVVAGRRPRAGHPRG
jgi:uncharacterized repeat protein (TIGR01451 family)